MEKPTRTEGMVVKTVEIEDGKPFLVSQRQAVLPPPERTDEETLASDLAGIDAEMGMYQARIDSLAEKKKAIEEDLAMLSEARRASEEASAQA